MAPSAISLTVLNGVFPKEILYTIFDFADLSGSDLKACRLVCKLWNETGKHNFLWYKCCVKEISSKINKNKFEKITLKTFHLSVDYRNLYAKYTVTQFSFQFFRHTREEYKMMRSETTPLQRKVETGLSYVICAPCCLFICGPIYFLGDTASRIQHAWTKSAEVCKCNSCDDTRVRLFSWAAEEREEKRKREKMWFEEEQRKVNGMGAI